MRQLQDHVWFTLPTNWRWRYRLLVQRQVCLTVKKQFHKFSHRDRHAVVCGENQPYCTTELKVDWIGRGSQIYELSRGCSATKPLEACTETSSKAVKVPCRKIKAFFIIYLVRQKTAFITAKMARCLVARTSAIMMSSKWHDYSVRIPIMCLMVVTLSEWMY